MNTTAEVYLWGTRIGVIHQDLNNSYASFEYDRDFIKSDIEVSPIMMPLSDTVYEFPMLSGEPFFGMPGLVADSLPDSFGNKVIEQWLALQGKSLSDFIAIDRLCYTGKRGMGALEYVPAFSEIGDIDDEINISEMVKFASDVLNQRESIMFSAKDNLTYSQLVQVGSSAGGARAKALIAWNEKTNEIRSGQLNLNKDYDYWLMKFDNVSKNGDHGLEDVPEYTLIEYVYYKMALDAGVKMSECRIYSGKDGNHFMTKRFDRVGGNKIHMQSLGAIAHISYKEPRLCSYEMAAQYMRELNLSMADIEQFFRRMVFNFAAVNQDDHVKNVSFLMDKNGNWSLSPAYDVTFSFDATNRWLRAHQMTVNGKVSDVDIVDLVTAGETMGLKQKKCMDIISEVCGAVNNFEKYATETNIKEKTYVDIKSIIDQYGVKTNI